MNCDIKPNGANDAMTMDPKVPTKREKAIGLNPSMGKPLLLPFARRLSFKTTNENRRAYNHKSQKRIDSNFGTNANTENGERKRTEIRRLFHFLFKSFWFKLFERLDFSRYKLHLVRPYSRSF